VYGVHAAIAAMRARPATVRQIVHSPMMAPVLAESMAPLVAKGVQVRVVSVDTLDRLCESTHHEGVLLLVTPTPALTVDAVCEALIRTKGFALALDRVGNPHNVGAILRSAAFFGIDAAIFEAPEGQRVLTPSAGRVAEGGAEHVLVARTSSLPDALAKMRRKGVSVVGTERRAERALFDQPLRGPAVLVLGNERDGLRDEVRALCDTLVSIRGTDRVDSLNVSVAAGILLAAAAHSRRG
jgi:TrmH RNA methyltransferase